MLAGGVHLKVVSERLGHSGIGITGDLYSHVLPKVQLDAVERQGLFILSSFPPLVIPAQAGIYIVLPRESCHRPL